MWTCVGVSVLYKCECVTECEHARLCLPILESPGFMLVAAACTVGNLLYYKGHRPEGQSVLSLNLSSTSDKTLLLLVDQIRNFSEPICHGHNGTYHNRVASELNGLMCTHSWHLQVSQAPAPLPAYFLVGLSSCPPGSIICLKRHDWLH